MHKHKLHYIYLISKFVLWHFLYLFYTVGIVIGGFGVLILSGTLYIKYNNNKENKVDTEFMPTAEQIHDAELGKFGPMPRSKVYSCV